MLMITKSIAFFGVQLATQLTNENVIYDTEILINLPFTLVLFSIEMLVDKL